MTEERTQRRLAAILAADVVGYSRLMEQDEAGTLATLKQRRREILSPLVAHHQGRIIKVMGDGVLVEFASAVNAVACAVELQKHMAAANDGIADGRRIALRVGINLGDVLVEGGDLYGDGVNVAARLQGVAEPGGIAISGNVRDLVRTKLNLSFLDLGEQRFKNIASPVRAFGIAGVKPSGSPPAIGSHRVGLLVLPFADLGGDNAGERLADGLTEDIITALSKLRWLSVVARTSSFVYKGKDADVRESARTHGVDFVLEGSVRRSGDRFRVVAQLIDAETGSHLWADRYERSTSDTFAVQDDLTQFIVAATEQALVVASVRAPSGGAAMEAEAAIGPLRTANRLMRRLDRDATSQAIDLLRLLLAAKPNSVAGHQFLSFAHTMKVAFCWSTDLAADLASAVAHGKIAVGLSDKDYLSYSCLAEASLYAGDFDLAISGARRGFELNPNSSTAVGVLAIVLAYAGDADEAGDLVAKVLLINPQDPCIAEYNWASAMAHIVRDRWAEAVRDADAGILLKPDIATGHLIRAAALVLHSRPGDARSAIREAQRCAKQINLSTVATAFPLKAAHVRQRLVAALRTAGLPK